MSRTGTTAEPLDPLLKPAPLFLLGRHRRPKPSDYDIFCRANARLTWDAVSARVVARRFLGWFYRFLPDAMRAMRKHGRNTSRALGRSLPGQFADMVLLANRGGMPPAEYYDFGLARFGGSEELRSFVAPRFHMFLALACARRRLRRFPDAPDLGDKVTFETCCAELGVPSVRTLAIVGANRVTDIRGETWAGDFGDRDIFVKPRGGVQGQGTLRVDNLGSGMFRAVDGTVVSGPALLADLSQRAKAADGELLVQEVLRNSRDLEAIAGRALATTRIITLLDETGEPEIVYAALRSGGSADSIVDNYHASGIAFPLDVETGELGAGRRLLFGDDPRFYQRHPVTGALVAGSRLAGWEAARSLALRLHRGSRHLLIVGWDVAITDDGPRVVEANIPPGLPIVQMQRGFLGTRYSALLARHILDWLEDDGEVGAAAVSFARASRDNCAEGP